MKLATIRTAETTSAVRIELDSATAVLLDATDVGALLADPLWRSKAADADGIVVSLDSIDYAPLIPRPDKIVCVGLNYRTHILEMGHDTPSYPTLFAKYRSSLIGANDETTRMTGVFDAPNSGYRVVAVAAMPSTSGSCPRTGLPMTISPAHRHAKNK